jgi:signal transduction histidine kinase
VALTAYRLVQEALGNSRQHAGVAAVRVVLDWRPGLLTLAVEDDGRGVVDEARGPGRRTGAVVAARAGAGVRRPAARRTAHRRRLRRVGDPADRADVGVSIRVLLVDDQPLLRTGFRLILQSEPDLEVVGEAPTARWRSRRSPPCGPTWC